MSYHHNENNGRIITDSRNMAAIDHLIYRLFDSSMRWLAVSLYKCGKKVLCDVENGRICAGL